LPTPGTARIHRIVVALGAGERIADHFGGNSRGSLMLASWLRSDDHINKTLTPFPFTIGHINYEKGFVHVFDDVTLDIVMDQLDTIADFVGYLSKKEEWLLSYPNILCAGEEEFLAFYLEHLDDEKGEFIPTAVRDAMAADTRIFIAEGHWDGLINGPHGAFRSDLKRQGQFVDQLIESFASHVVARTLAYGNDERLETHERNLRFLVSEPRWYRAYFTRMIMQKMAVSPPNRRTSVVLRSSRKDRLYIFLLFPRSVGQTQHAYRKERQGAMTAYCFVAKYLNPEVRYVICLSTEPGDALRARSEDIMSFDFEQWTKDDDAAAAKVQKEFDILTEVTMRRFPEELQYVPAGPDGNRHSRRMAKALKRRKSSR
jgi:hypothetical protein